MTVPLPALIALQVFTAKALEVSMTLPPYKVAVPAIVIPPAAVSVKDKVPPAYKMPARLTAPVPVIYALPIVPTVIFVALVVMLLAGTDVPMLPMVEISVTLGTAIEPDVWVILPMPAVVPPTAVRVTVPALPAQAEQVLAAAVMLPLNVIALLPALLEPVLPEISKTVYPFCWNDGDDEVMPAWVLSAVTPLRYISPLDTIGTIVRLSPPRLRVSETGVPFCPIEVNVPGTMPLTPDVDTLIMVGDVTEA